MKSFVILFFIVFNIYANEIIMARNENATHKILNPHLYSPNQMWAQNLVYEGLFDFKNGKVIPALATDYKIENNGTTYIFNLRKNVKFSNGEDFNASVVKKNFDAIMNDKERHNWLELVDNIKDYKILSPFEFELNLKRPYNQTIRELSYVRPFRFAPLSAFSGDSSSSINKSIGTNKFILKSVNLGSSDEFVANKNYWGDKPKTDKIITRIIPDESAKILALKNGDIDIIYNELSLKNFNKFKSSFNHEQSADNITLAIILNSTSSPTNKLCVREALNYGMDKSGIVKSLFEGLNEAKNLFKDINRSKFISYDPKKAIDLLKNCGFEYKDNKFYDKGKELSIDFIYEPKEQVIKNLIQILKFDYEKIGIKLNPIPLEESIYVKRARDGLFNGTLMQTWGDPYGTEGFISSFKHKSHSDFIAQSGLKFKKQVDENLTKLAYNNDEVDYKNIVVNYLEDECIYIPIVYIKNMALFNKNIKNFKVDTNEYSINLDNIEK